MMDLSQATEWKNVKERADKINKEALELQELFEKVQQEVQKAQEEVQRLKAQLQPKRTRIETQEEEEEAQEEVQKAQEEVQRLKAQLQPKRARIETQEEEEDVLHILLLLVPSLFSRTRTRSCIRHCLTRFISGCAKLCSQEAHCLEGRSVHRDQGNRDLKAQEEGC